MKALSTPWLRVLLLPVLLGLLGSCAVYDRVFHPHRLPTPPLSATAKAKAKAAEKARHKGTSLKAMEATSATATDGAGADAGAADEKKKTMSYSDLPEGTKLKYDKQGLVKKSTLNRLEDNRRQLHHYDTRPLTPREASRENRKLRKKGHQNHGKDAKDPAPARTKDLPAAPAPDPTQPAEPTPAPAPKAPEKKAKDKKAPLPKPDPTQPAPDGSHQ
ncbi:hypothetical protein E4631_20420 [Hymenobacter sp. UV11]|uniref:hypothetical protein n=1 Tax=Hymenobacter sp. UV11 TaxID=1849735 RepID=UPI00105CE949|nr:hypothetical protein [Hymenobacter sp. UV11]TFZ63993.1 hypothetical protein E4631_20420 [Hymenobacter sp. UV11]